MRTQLATNITQRSPPPMVKGQSSPAASLRLAPILGLLDRRSLSSAAPRRLPAHAVFADCPAHADLANLAAALGSARLVLASVAAAGHVDYNSAASGDGSFPCLYRLVVESPSPQIDIRPFVKPAMPAT